MTRSTLPAEDCVFRLDYRDKFRQAFPMTFNNVGLSGDGFVFTGIIGEYIELNDCIDNNIVNEMSFEFIFKDYAHTISSERYLLSCYNWTDKTGYSIFTNDGKLYSGIYNGVLRSDLPYNYDINTEYHCVITFDGSTARLYMDGIQVKSGSLSGFSPRSANIYIGSSNSGGTSGNRVIKLMTAYNVCLTPQEVLDRYNEVTFNVC